MAEKNNHFDIDSAGFNPDLYLEKLLRECSLKQVMDEEYAIKRDAQTLHSDMQTLVYENYNKFISATDTIKKMKTDFKKMEDEMDLLVNKMASVIDSSQQISSTLQTNRNQIQKLSSVDSLLKQLQFLFKLPERLATQIAENNYEEAVQDYLHAEQVLEQYGNLESFQGIREDCHNTLEQLKETLRNQFRQKEASAKELTQTVKLLLQLKEAPSTLCSEYLSHCEIRLSSSLEYLTSKEDYEDLLEFVQQSSDGFVNDLCLMISCYNHMFISTDSEDPVTVSKLNSFVVGNMKCYFDLISTRLEKESNIGDTSILVRALDRFYRKVQTVSTLFAYTDFSITSQEIIIKAARRQCKLHLNHLKLNLTESLNRLRQNLLSPKLATVDLQQQNQLSSELMALGVAIVEKIKAVLQDLMLFIQPDIGFSSKRIFQENYCIDSVREGLVVSFLHHFNATALNFTQHHSTPPLPLLLILCKTCLEYETNHVTNLLNITDEWFNVNDLSKNNKNGLTQPQELCSLMKNTAQELINTFVQAQGLVISQMLRKSVEAKDWLHGIEPRNVRAVMKRVIEELTLVDSQVGSLFEEDQKQSRSSDSSLKTQSRYLRSTAASTWSNYTTMTSPHTLAINKLFSQRVQIFSSNVTTFSKTSILTNIIKISLKTLLECVRLKTFSKYGFQQVQVDLHYLQLYLWRFVSDENLIHFLLDEIMGSAMVRCVDTVLMEPSVVEIICERG